VQPVLPTSVAFGDPRAEAIYCLMMVLAFTVAAVLLFVFLTRETGLRADLSAVAGRKLPTIPARKALLILLPPWLLASGWFYNATLGDQFYEVRRKVENNTITWELVYAYPERVRFISNDQVMRWTGKVGWERRSFRHSLVLELANGRMLRSAKLHPEQFEERARTLDLWGIHVLPPATNSTHIGEPATPIRR
jgi:hypothetical protein